VVTRAIAATPSAPTLPPVISASASWRMSAFTVSGRSMPSSGVHSGSRIAAAASVSASGDPPVQATIDCARVSSAAPWAVSS
jgi:hypothetical protein